MCACKQGTCPGNCPCGCNHYPKGADTTIEWGFDGQSPALVACVPDGEGNWTAIRLDAMAPTNLHEREFVAALLRIAQRLMDGSEPDRKCDQRPPHAKAPYWVETGGPA